MDKEFQLLVLRFMANVSNVLLNITPTDVERFDRLYCDIDGLIDKLEEEE